MNEGKELLIKIIENKQMSISSLNKEDIIFENVNLVDLSKKLHESIDYISELSDNLIDKIIADSNYKKTSFKKDLYKLRDLLIGKRDYNLKINLSKEQYQIYETLIKLLDEVLEKSVPGIVNVEELEKSCNNLMTQIRHKEIINDFSFIEDITQEYNAINKDANLIKIMKFVNEHNLKILKSSKKNGPILEVQFVRRPKLDNRIKEILDKLEIEYKELPNYLLGELKRCDVESVYKTFSLVKKNKAEDYGILHLIKKSNVLAKLVLILYATEESVKSVVDSLKNKDESIDINLLRVVLNYILPAFLSKKNEYFRPKNYEYTHNINLLKELGVNYKALINKTPLFLISNNEALEYTLNYLESNGANKKTIINRCYKTLVNAPSIIIENVETLKSYGVNMETYFAGANYNLLKVRNLKGKINYLANKNNLDLSTLDCELINKMIVGKVYRECLNNQVMWSE